LVPELHVFDNLVDNDLKSNHHAFEWIHHHTMIVLCGHDGINENDGIGG
jgi:hypothetical protein